MSIINDSVQDQVSNQVQEISNFIDKHSAQGDNSSTFRVLQTLYSLFQTEVSINMSLRKVIHKSKQTATQNTNFLHETKFQMDNFLKSTSIIANISFSDLNQVINHLSDMQKNIKKYRTKYHNFKKENRILLQEIDFIRAQSIVDMASVQAKAEKEQEQSQFLQKRCDSLEKTISDYQEDIETAKFDKSRHESQIQISKIIRLKQKKDQLKSYVKDLLTQLDQLKADFNNSENMLKSENKQLKYDVQQKEKEIEELVAENHHLTSKIQKLTNQMSIVKKCNLGPIFQAYNKIRNELDFDEDVPPRIVSKAVLQIIQKNRSVSFDLQEEISALQREIVSMENDISPVKNYVS